MSGMILINHWIFEYDDVEGFMSKISDILSRENKVGIQCVNKLIVYEFPGNSVQLKDHNIWEFTGDKISGMWAIKPINSVYKYSSYYKYITKPESSKEDIKLPQIASFEPLKIEEFKPITGKLQIKDNQQLS